MHYLLLSNLFRTEFGAVMQAPNTTRNASWQINCKCWSCS